MVRAVATRYFMRMKMTDVPKELGERASKTGIAASSLYQQRMALLC